MCKMHVVISLFNRSRITLTLSQFSCAAQGDIGKSGMWSLSSPPALGLRPCGYMTAARDLVMTKPPFQNVLSLLYLMLCIVTWGEQMCGARAHKRGEGSPAGGTVSPFLGASCHAERTQPLASGSVNGKTKPSRAPYLARETFTLLHTLWLTLPTQQPQGWAHRPSDSGTVGCPHLGQGRRLSCTPGLQPPVHPPSLPHLSSLSDERAGYYSTCLGPPSTAGWCPHTFRSRLGQTRLLHGESHLSTSSQSEWEGAII